MKKILSSSETSQASSSSSRPNLLCVVTDRMNLGFLGAYGNDWVQTDAFDRLAFESTVFDQYYAETLDLTALYYSFWTGFNPAESVTPGTAASAISDKKGVFSGFRRHSPPVEGLPADFSGQGYQTILITDSSEIARHPAARGFGRVEFIDSPPATEPASSVEETATFALFTKIAELTAESAEGDVPFFIWAHLTGFGGVWDFSTELRMDCVEDEEDPAPYDGVVPPFFDYPVSLRLRKTKGTSDFFHSGPDPADSAYFDAMSKLPSSKSSVPVLNDEPDFDKIQAVAETYAAGMTVWDLSLGGLIEMMKEVGIFDSTLILLGSTRGFPLGEHGRVGVPPVESPASESKTITSPDDSPRSAPGEMSLFYSEELHLPLLIHFPDHVGKAVRSSGICGAVDLYRTLAEYTHGPNKEDGNKTLRALAEEETDTLHSHLILVEKDAASPLRAVLTDEWFLIQRPNGSGTGEPSLELFVRPDDRWDVNEVADRCEETVEKLRALLDVSSEKKEG